MFGTKTISPIDRKIPCFRIFSKSEQYKKNTINPVALRKAKIVYNFGLSECNRLMPAIMFS